MQDALCTGLFGLVHGCSVRVRWFLEPRAVYGASLITVNQGSDNGDVAARNRNEEDGEEVMEYGALLVHKDANGHTSKSVPHPCFIRASSVPDPCLVIYSSPLVHTYTCHCSTVLP